MPPGKKILVIIGSASANSSNQKLLEQVLQNMGTTDFQMYTDLSVLPHFDTALTDDHTPEEVLKIREDIKNASGVIFSTPEYIFSIPGRLKNLLELILKTLGAVTDDKHQALIKGIKGKFDGNGLLESNTFVKVSKLVTDFISSVS